MPEEHENPPPVILVITGMILLGVFVLAWNWHDFLVWLCYWC